MDGQEFHLSVKTLITELVLGELLNINQRLAQIESNQRKIMGNQADEAVALQAIADDLVKVKSGIDALKQSVADLTAALANAPSTPEVDAALSAVQANLAQVDADLPQPPAPAPAP